MLCLQYYHRKKSQENQSPFIIQLEDDPDTTDTVWTPGCFKKPLVRRVEDISRNLRTPLNLPVRTTKVSSDPPWKPPKLTLRPDIPNINKDDSREQKRATTLDTINTEYSDHTLIARVTDNKFFNFVYTSHLNISVSLASDYRLVSI